MRIKELEDVLTLVDELPRRKQLRCVERLSALVGEWEMQVADGMEHDDVGWLFIWNARMHQRLMEMVEEKEQTKKGRRKRF